MFSRLLKFLVDGGYTGEYFASSVHALTEAVVEVAKRNKSHKFEVIQTMDTRKNIRLA